MRKIMFNDQSRIGTLALGVLLTCAGMAARADDWPQWLGPKRDGIWRETGLLEQFPKEGPRVLWREKIGPGYTGPAVVGNRVYLMDRQGSALGKGIETPGKDGLASKERVLCLDAQTGKPVWTREYDCTYKIYYPSGPRTTPVVQGDRVYTLGSMGDLYCLKSADGAVVWSRNLLTDYKTKPPIWGYAAHLLVDGDLVFTLAGGENTAVVALDKNTGKERWHALTVQEVGYAPPMMIEANGKRQLLIWHTEAVNALDPETGKVYWSVRFPEDGEPVRPGITVAAPRQVGDRLFVSSVHHGSLMLELAADKPSAKVLWHGKSRDVSKPDGLHALLCTPVVQDGYVYGVGAFGDLRCIKADTGETVWETYAATAGKKALFATAFLVPQGDRCFLFNDNGDLIICRLTPKGYTEIDRAHLLEPTLHSRGRDVVWSHPAFANRCVYVRNDEEVICVSLAAA
jgi:outer membrane protein assembly factor BamB